MNSLFFGGIVLLTNSCYTAPEFPLEPNISFNSIVFNKGAEELDPDSLILTINFEDGDGDLGLQNDGSDTRAPYNDLWFFQYNDGNLLRTDDINAAGLVTYSDRNLPGLDTLPPYEFPYYCQNYILLEENESVDTVYVQANEFHHNIKVKYFVRKNGEYNEFNFETAFDPLCGETFDGRYPLLNFVGRNRPLEGTLKYKMQSAGFELLFRLDTLMLEVFIYDRAGNKSNTVQTPDFVIRDITIGG